MPPTRKFEYGHSKRKRKRQDELIVQSQRGALDKFIVKQPVNVEINNEEREQPIEATTNGEDHVQVEVEEDDNVHIEENVETLEDEVVVEPDLNGNGDNIGDIGLNIYDPRVWDNLAPKWKELLVRNGSVRDILNEKDPKYKLGRRFSYKFYTRYLPNGEKHDRNWLVYSKDIDKVFCFCCKLFQNKIQPSQLATDGVNDWKHMSDILKSHERSAKHINHMAIWVDLYARLENNQVIDKVVQDQIMQETEHWRNVLQMLFGFVQFLSKQNLAFRGSNEKIFEESNGNFMALVEMVAKWDSTLKEHLRRKQNREIHYHYLSHKIQNEMIFLLASEVKHEIIRKIKQARYFSIILDCTPDVSKNEQMTLLRCVDVSTAPIKVEEFFLKFLVVYDSTGQGLFDELQNALHHLDLDLDIDNVRGQSYNNGANMKGKHKGVQTKLLDINPKAFYTHCGSHSLNLTLLDIANSCRKASDFFGVIQSIYTLFADSPKRWKILKDNLPTRGFTLKKLLDTRWESRVNSVKAIVTQAPEIREALLELGEVDDEANVRIAARSLAKHLESFEFTVGMVIWYDILVKVNIVSKELQSEDMCIDGAMASVKALISSLHEFRQYGFDKALDFAKMIANDLDIDPVIQKPDKRERRKKRFR